MKALRFMAVGCLASVAALSLAQKSVWERAWMLEDPLEQFMDKPAPPRPWTVTNDRCVVPLGNFTSVQVNVNGQGQNILNDAANEPSIAISATNPNVISIGWRQFDNVGSNFREGGYAYSSDGGASWTFPGVLQNNVFRSDPVLMPDPNGNLHYNSLQQTFFTDEYFSSNNGQTYTNLGPSTGGDKQWIMIDRTNSTGNGFIYQAWSTAGNNYGGRQFSRSTNGGSVWMNPINLPNQPVWGTMDVDSSGNLYLIGMGAQSGLFYVLKSTNAKNSAVTPTFSSTQVNLGGDIVFQAPVNPEGLGGQLWVACDRSGGSTDGNIYALSTIDRNASNPADVMFSRSTNGGTTWSAPVRLNTDAQNAGKYHWFGTLSVAPNGRLDACWYDTRNSANNTSSELWYCYSLDGGLTWSANIQISPAFQNNIGYPNQNKLGDYIGMVSQNNSACIAYAATFTGGQDVYFVRVNAFTTELPPLAFSMFRGQVASGNLQSLVNADADYLVALPGLTLNPTEAPVQYVFETDSTTATPTSLSFKYIAKASSTSLRQVVSMFNYQTNAYEDVDTRNATLSDSTVTVTASGDLSRFVNQGTLRMKSRVSYKAAGPIASYPWTSSANQVLWTVGP